MPATVGIKDLPVDELAMARAKLLNHGGDR
jgi:hypothetical protein